MFPETSEDILAKLVSFDTTSRDSNLPLIAWMEAYLDHHDVAHFRVDYETGKKSNLFATLGPDVEGGVVLSGHTDVVPVDGQEWSSDPFVMREEQGLLYGRGTADMKGFIAVVLALVPRFKKSALKVPIHFAFSCDEEVGCRGVVPLIEHMRDHLKKPSAVIVGEPTSMKVVNAHKSAVRFATEVTGFEGHSAHTDKGVNAIMVAAELISEINAIRQDFIAAGDPTGRFDPPYSTIHVGVVEGGTANNIIPRQCAFSWETRLIPGAEKFYAKSRLDARAKKLQGPMRAIALGTGIATDVKTDVPGLAPQVGSAAETLALHCAQANETHTVAYCTEAGHFQGIGIPTVVCGPGSILQAHKPDEFIAVEQLRMCETFMQRLAARCC